MVEPGKVARELVSEALDVWQLLTVHITEPCDTVLKGDNIVEILSGKEGEAL